MGNAANCFRMLPAMRNISPEVGTTYDPLKKASTGITLSNGNMTVDRTIGGYAWGSVQSENSQSSGKYYCEWQGIITTGSVFPNFVILGISSGTFDVDDKIGDTSVSYGKMGSDTGKIYYNNGSGFSYSNYGATYGDGDTIGMAVDFDANKLWYSKNGVWQASGNPVAGTGEWPIVSATYFITGSLYSTSQHTLVTSVADFNYTMPSGFSIWD